MKRILPILFILAALFTSCEDVVQVKLDEGSKKYVIDAFVNNLRTTQIVRVHYNIGYFSNAAPPPVENAVVTITDLNVGKSFSFAYAGDGKYTYPIQANDTLGRIGHSYRLDVTIDGHTFSSESTQHRAASIDSISVLLLGQGGFGPPSEDSVYVCQLWAKDKVDQDPDYYWIRTYRNDTLMMAPSDINVSIDGTGGATSDAGVDSLDFTPPATFLGFRLFGRGDKCQVEVHSISRDCYFFFVQVSAQINNGGLFATTPENVKTNIVSPGTAPIKAVGWFNMSSSVSRSRIVD